MINNSIKLKESGLFFYLNALDVDNLVELDFNNVLDLFSEKNDCKTYDDIFLKFFKKK